MTLADLPVVRAATGQRLLELERDALLSALERSGALLLRGFSFEDREFSTLTERFSEAFFTHPKRKSTLDEHTIEVVPGHERVAPHQELGYLPFRPDYLWLYCRVPASAGGRTIVHPAEEFLAELSPTTRRLFEDNEITYQHRWHEDMWRSYWPRRTMEEVQDDLRGRDGVVVHADGDERVLRFDYRTSALVRGRRGEALFLNSVLNMLDVMRKGDATAVVSFANGRPFSGALIDELEAVAERVSSPVQWEPKDVLIVDNKRAMHSREAFRGERDLVVRIGAHARWR